MSSYFTESTTPPPHLFPTTFFLLQDYYLDQAKFKLSELNELNGSFGEGFWAAAIRIRSVSALPLSMAPDTAA